MTPEEINKMVAIKLGREETSECFHNCGCNSVPKYCIDIDDAWEIVLTVNAGKWMIFNPGNTNTWVASITDLPDGSKSDAEADTAPMAIALAFLKLEEIKLDRKG